MAQGPLLLVEPGLDGDETLAEIVRHFARRIALSQFLHFASQCHHVLVTVREGRFDRFDLVVEQALVAGFRITLCLGGRTPRFVLHLGDRVCGGEIPVGTRFRSCIFGSRSGITSHLFDDCVEHVGVQHGFLFDGSEQKEARHDLVYLARYPTRRLVQPYPDAAIEFRRTRPVHMLKAMHHIRFDFAGLHRLEMMGGDDPLA